ncbi:MAG: hypothetical protein DI582_08415 [Azospirillum brasilense]|nr:MAG: hypothetical protein DI582_08415 [Azospirillum brasilense]
MMQPEPVMQQAAPMAPAVQAAPLPPVAQATPQPGMDLPPVDAATQRIADARLAAEAKAQGRAVPSENMQLAGNYPQLSNVPPAPVMQGEQAASERLAKVRTELEQQRVQTEAAKVQLERDAAAEPSMLSELPSTRAVTGNAPAPMPAPAAAPMNAPAPAAVSVPPAAQVRGGIADLPPPPPLKAAPAPTMAPAAAPAPGKGAQAPIQMDHLPMGTAAPAPAAAAPMQTAGLEPIQLRPPGFDPMASGSGATQTAMAPTGSRMANQFLPTSRYAYRR